MASSLKLAVLLALIVTTTTVLSHEAKANLDKDDEAMNEEIVLREIAILGRRGSKMLTWNILNPGLKQACSERACGRNIDCLFVGCHYCILVDHRCA